MYIYYFENRSNDFHEIQAARRLEMQKLAGAGLLLGSSNPHPSHSALSFLLDSPPIIIHPAYSIHVLWTLSSSHNSDPSTFCIPRIRVED